MDVSIVIVLTIAVMDLLLGCFSLLLISWAVALIENLIHDHRREKRKRKAERDKEYHDKRMENLMK
jgi:hypothetical protein